MSEQVDLLIEKLVHGGEGLARLPSGQAVFVPGVLPGEEVRARLARRSKGVYRAELIEIITPSQDRTAPPCTGELECTGATWSHIAYPAQLRIKEEILLDTLGRIGGIGPKTLLPILPSPVIDHYRLRTQFTVRTEADGQKIGFFRQGTYRLVEVENAFLLHPLINRTLSAIRGLSGKLPPLSEIHINVTPADEAHLLFFTHAPSCPPLGPFLDELRRRVPGVVGITGFANRKKAFTLGRNYLTLEAGGLTYRATEGNFYQVNWEQNRNMIRTVLEFAGPESDETVLDLYCGIGNFALPLAKRAKRVIGIESGYSAIEDAKRNAELNGIRNAEFLADDLEKGLKKLLEQKTRANVIVLDPPRSGATLKTTERVLAFVPRKIVYVSCNPSTLARDLKYFALFGFRVDRLRPVDMFPWTYHIECVAEMVREG